MDKDSKGQLSTGQLSDIARLKYPNIYRNNRGCVKKGNAYIRFGIPEPKTKEKDTDYKGGDFVGFKTRIVSKEMLGNPIAVFTNVEIKGPHDKIKEGQIRFHNMTLKRGGISEIHFPDGSIINYITTKEEVNGKT